MTTRPKFGGALIGFGLMAALAGQAPLLATNPAPKHHGQTERPAAKPPASFCYFEYQYRMDEQGTISLKGLRHGKLAPVAQISDAWTKTDGRYADILERVAIMHPDFSVTKNAKGTTRWEC